MMLTRSSERIFNPMRYTGINSYSSGITALFYTDKCDLCIVSWGNILTQHQYNNVLIYIIDAYDIQIQIFIEGLIDIITNLRLRIC